MKGLVEENKYNWYQIILFGLGFSTLFEVAKNAVLLFLSVVIFQVMTSQMLSVSLLEAVSQISDLKDHNLK